MHIQVCHTNFSGEFIVCKGIILGLEVATLQPEFNFVVSEQSSYVL